MPCRYSSQIFGQPYSVTRQKTHSLCLLSSPFWSWGLYMSEVLNPNNAAVEITQRWSLRQRHHRASQRQSITETEHHRPFLILEIRSSSKKCLGPCFMSVMIYSIITAVVSLEPTVESTLVKLLTPRLQSVIAIISMLILPDTRESSHPVEGQENADSWANVCYFVWQWWFDSNLW